MSPAEILKEVQIKPIEMECLKRVFEYLSKHNQSLVNPNFVQLTTVSICFLKWTKCWSSTFDLKTLTDDYIFDFPVNRHKEATRAQE